MPVTCLIPIGTALEGGKGGELDAEGAEGEGSLWSKKGLGEGRVQSLFRIHEFLYR